MNQQRLQSAKPIDVILMLDDGTLSKGIVSLLLKKKNLCIHRIVYGNDEVLAVELAQERKKVVIVDSTYCCHHSSKCLISLLSTPEVEEVLMVNSDDNLVQVLKKQQIVLTD